jgi:hypothetical protein
MTIVKLAVRARRCDPLPRARVEIMGPPKFRNVGGKLQAVLNDDQSILFTRTRTRPPHNG